MKRKLRYTIAIILIIIMAIIIGSLIFRYHAKSSEVYTIDSENLIDDGGFENFNQTAGDCCNSIPGNTSIFATKSQDYYSVNYSLNLTSFNHCACINKLILNFSNLDTYLLSFYYKGDNPKFCDWVIGDNKCMPLKKLNTSSNWMVVHDLLVFTPKSESSSIYLYADSSGTPVTNLYDDLEVHRLQPTTWEEVVGIEDVNSDFALNAPQLAENNSYIIKTNPDNIVNGEKLNDNGYYLVMGKPEITLRFPWTEIVILAVMMLIVIRLLFKKQAHEIEEEISHELRHDVEKAIKFYGK